MIIGHNKIIDFLKKGTESGSLSHAYLFFGPEHIGKRTVAMEFAKMAQCEDPNKKPCYKCRSCKDIERGTHLDFTLVEPQISEKGKETEISIKQIRELIRTLSLSPSQGNYKIAIIDRVERMTREAANSLLKTLEEPRGNTILILICNYLNFLPDTIISRTQLIKFRPVPKEELKEALKKEARDPKLVQEVLEFSGGRPGLTLTLLKNKEELSLYKKRVKEFSDLVSQGLDARFRYIKKMNDDPSQIHEILNIWMIHLRQLMKSRDNNTKPFSGYNRLDFKNIISAVKDTDFLISNTNVNSRLALEVLMLKL